MNESMYDNMYELEHDHWWFVVRRKIIITLLEGFFVQQDSHNEILDVGCGTGYILERLRDLGKVQGIDMNEKAIMYARQRLGQEVLIRKMIIHDLGNEEYFDTITFFDVLEHIEDDINFLQQLKKHLRDGAIVCLTVPAYQWLWSSHDEFNQHYRRYTKKSLRTVLEESGYQVERITYFNTILFPFAVLQKIYLRFKHNSGIDTAPNPILNKIFTALFALEAKILKKINLPFGVSLFVIAKKKV